VRRAVFFSERRSEDGTDVPRNPWRGRFKMVGVVLAGIVAGIVVGLLLVSLLINN
jgi:hypothetical protein